MKIWNTIYNITELESGYTAYTNILEIYRLFLIQMFNEYYAYMVKI